MLECCQQKNAKPASSRVGVGEIVLFEQTFEECLRQILGVMNVRDATANVRVEWKPVRLAETFQSRGGFTSPPLTSHQHEAPVRRVEATGTC